MTEHPRISLAPDVLAGKPVISGTRIAVEFIIGLMDDGWSEADILANYPGLSNEDVLACLNYAGGSQDSQTVTLRFVLCGALRRRASLASVRWHLGRSSFEARRAVQMHSAARTSG
ncbi:uncharacterized protein (DUF433 family) [Bradyrhizobium sp. USDA 4354]